MALVLITPPEQEPLSLLETKAHLRVDIDEDDTLIEGLIVAAREYVETVTRRQLVTATWDYVVDEWPDWDRRCRYWGQREWRYGVMLPKTPIQAVTTVSYVDDLGVTQTLATTVYRVLAGEPTQIILGYEQTWPTTRDIPQAVTVRFVAGYGTPEQVPESLKVLLKLLIAHWYEHRTAVHMGTMNELPMAVKSLLWSHRMVEVA